MEYLQKILKKTGWISIIESIIFAFLGAILIYNPDVIIKIISYIIGAIFIIAGFIKIYNYIQTKGKNDLYNYDLIYGILAAVVGIISIIYSGTIGTIFRIIIGLWILYTGIIRFSSSIKLKNMKSKFWITSMVISIIMLIISIYIILNSGAIIATIGGIMIVYSIMDIIESIILIRNLKDMY